MSLKRNDVKILCYAETNVGTGKGHYTRLRILISLLKKKKKNLKITLVTNKNNYASNFFDNVDYIIYKNLNLKEYLLKNLNKFDIFILDPPYYVGKKTNNGFYWSNLKKLNPKIKIIRLTEEFLPTRHKVDILINHYPYANKFKEFYMKFNSAKKYYLGANSFFYPTHININKNKENSFFVAFGGDDNTNLVKKLNTLLMNIKIKKIIFIKKKQLNYFNKKNLNKKFTKYIVITDQEKFLKLISKCSFYISTPSNIMYECSYFGLSGLVISTHLRQKRQIKYFKKLNFVKSFSNPKILTEKFITKNFDFNKKKKKYAEYPKDKILSKKYD